MGAGTAPSGSQAREEKGSSRREWQGTHKEIANRSKCRWRDAKCLDLKSLNSKSLNSSSLDPNSPAAARTTRLRRPSSPCPRQGAAAEAPP